MYKTLDSMKGKDKTEYWHELPNNGETLVNNEDGEKCAKIYTKLIN